MADYTCNSGFVSNECYDHKGCQIVEVAVCHSFVMSITAVIGIEEKITRC